MWRRHLTIVCGIQWLVSSGITLMMPFLPLFLQAELGIRGGGEAELWAGFLIAATPLMAALFAPLWGALADRHGRKVMVVRAVAAIALFTTLISRVRTPWELLALRLLMGSFTGFHAAAVSLVADITPREHLGLALGRLQGALMAGTVFGPLFGGALAHALGYRSVFLVTGGLTGLAALAAHLLVPDAARVGAPRAARQPLWKGIRAVASEPEMLVLFVALFATQLAVRNVNPILPLFVQSLAGESLGQGKGLELLVGAIHALPGVGTLIAAPFLGQLADRIGHRRVLVWSLAGAAAVTLPLAWAATPWQVAAPRFLLGISLGGIQPVSQALVGLLAPRDRAGGAYGLSASATFLGNFAGPIMGGALAATFGLGAVFYVTGGLLIANALWVAQRLPNGAQPARTDGLSPAPPPQLADPAAEGRDPPLA